MAVAAAAGTYSPRPASVPSAEASQIELAVVRPLIFSLFVDLEDRARAEKADAGGDALDDARDGFRLLAANRQAADHEHGAADGDHHVGPQSGKMAVELAFQADHAAQDGGRADPRQVVDEDIEVEIQHGDAPGPCVLTRSGGTVRL